MNNILTYALIGINLVAFAMYGIDKYKAKKAKWRIPEAQLLGVAALGGAFGAWAAMRMFRHKTQHKKFTICVPIFVIAWTFILYWCYFK